MKQPAAPGVKLTYDDFLLFPDDGKRHELIDGEHYVTPSPNTRHQRISGRLYLLIGNWLEVHPIGQLTSPSPVGDRSHPTGTSIASAASSFLTTPSCQRASLR